MFDQFYFHGKIPASKSILNRALVIQSFCPKLQITGGSQCDDVIFLKRALSKIESGREYYCGDGGTTLRFLALRLSRQAGEYLIRGSQRLFERPQSAILTVLSQLGVHAVQKENTIKINSKGWTKPSGPLQVPVGESSQFLSAILLSAWDLDFPLDIIWDLKLTSRSYFELTKEICQFSGMSLISTGVSSLQIPAGSKVQIDAFDAESDLSSAISIAIAAALGGKAHFQDFPFNSKQPDIAFIKAFMEMGVDVKISGNELSVVRPKIIKPIEMDISQCPDVFPVMSVLCAYAKGTSRLWGAPQLIHKESNRIGKVVELLTKAGVSVEPQPDGIIIHGNLNLHSQDFYFDPDHDHRMAMAAGLMCMMGHQIRLADHQVVAKSFPEFWHVMGLGPLAVVGHRGTGKTNFLDRVKTYNPQLQVFDLDQMIVEKTGRSIRDIFSFDGEKAFRKIELSCLRELLEKIPLNSVVTCGAGILVDQIPDHIRILWLRRETDLDGRIFLNRPRLDHTMGPLEEYRSRAVEREDKFHKKSHWSLTMLEGQFNPSETEYKAFRRWWGQCGGSVTLQSHDLYSLPPGGARYYEIRDDLVEEFTKEALFQKIPSKNIIYSVRKDFNVPDYVLRSQARIDWALEMGFPTKEFIKQYEDRLIISQHSHCLKDALLDIKIFSHSNVSLKLAPLVESFEELKLGHQWMMQNPEKRSFLPRSHNGRWSWYRLLMKNKMEINYFREGLGSSPDQPTLVQWLTVPDQVNQFGAVIGSPVHHSYSPVTHGSAECPFFAIDVTPAEFDFALSFLAELGAVKFAVTSPLKSKAYQIAQTRSEVCQQFEVANTLMLKDHNWSCENTDFAGLQFMTKNLPIKTAITAVWGGGGTLPLLKKVFADAQFYSSTKNHSEPKENFSPECLIWAAPRGELMKFPPEEWQPKIVIDLNYKEDSAGLEYAAKVGAQYISGLDMFYEQARLQSEFWKGI